VKPRLYIGLPGNEAMAARLAALENAETGLVNLHTFPDGETGLRFLCDMAERDVVLVCTLVQPNEKILSLIFAALEARARGARQVGLVAPYLAYMRQDSSFQPGEAVTSRAFAQILSQNFDWLVTMDPHLHRIHALGEIYSVPAVAVHSGPALASWIGANVTCPFLIGPDEESRQWVGAVAAACGAPFAVLHKSRAGDRRVSIDSIPAGATPVLLDDIISSGSTAAEVLRHLPAGHSPVVLAIHGVFAGRALNEIQRVAQVVTTNSIPGPTAQIDIAPLIADAVRALGKRPRETKSRS
jgi:ribose-phosphate pyrophosphokinase